MTEIFFVVHANSTWNELGLWQGHCDTELSTTGMRMAQLLAGRKDLSRVQKIYSSDLKRALQTAEPLAGKIRKGLIQDCNLREGNWEVHDRHPGISVLPAPYPYETRTDVQRRAVDTIEHLLNKNTLTPILIITHGTFLECLLEHILPDINTAYKGIRTAVNSFTFTKNKWIVNKLNDYSHLPRLQADMICDTCRAI